jgi:Tol biopolymer transport system component
MNHRIKVSAAALAALCIVALTPIAASATFPGGNGRIIFNRGSTESPTFLVTIEPDGSDPTNIAGQANSSFGASWDPDGSRFIYSRLAGGNVDLFMRDADGSNPTRVTDTNRDEFQVAFGPDGNQAVYEKCGFQCDLFIINLTTGVETRLTDTRADEIAPDWGVDDVIVFERVPQRSDIDIFTIHPDGSNLTRLTDNEVRQDVSASWSPDGTRIVYSRCGFESGCDLFTMDPDGSGKDRVTDTTRRDEFGAKFSPNGNSFVFVGSRGETRSDLFRMRTNGSNVRKLTDTPNKFEVDPDWQPLPKP